MTVETAAQAAYIVAALLFILALAGLSNTRPPRPATPSAWRHGGGPGGDHRAGDRPRHLRAPGWACWSAAMLVGAAIGLWRARVVEMTGMPELIALLH